MNSASLWLAATLCVATAVVRAAPDSNPKLAATLPSDAGRVVVDVQGVPPPAPLFFSASVEQTFVANATEIAGEAKVRLRVLQGKPELLSLGLAGDGEVVDVSGAGLRDWSVRQGVGATSGKRFLDLRPVLPAGPATSAPVELNLVVRTRLRITSLPSDATLTTLTPGDAVGFSSVVTLRSDDGVQTRVAGLSGAELLADPAPAGNLSRFSGREPRIQIQVTRQGAIAADAEFFGAQLNGKLASSGKTVDFRLRGQLRAQKVGARVVLLSRRAALNDAAVGDGWHVELTPKGDQFVYELVADRAGVLNVELPFAGEVREENEWLTLNFAMPAATVTPLQLEGLGSGVSFRADAPVMPLANGELWKGYLPADGAAAVAWKRKQDASEGALFFTSYELADVRVGAGLLRESSQLSLRMLQGKLSALRIRLEGSGEVLGVEGETVVGWTVRPIDGGGRALDVQFSRPIEGEGVVVVRSQTELGGFPVRVEPLRLVPENAVQHSGFLRVANEGAVRLEVTEVTGMMQLAPEQFPGEPLERNDSHVFVYRFPASAHAFHVVASQIQPEINLSQVVTYELGETDRAINASLELDIREAPLSDWAFEIPDDYTVVAVKGAYVSDYAVESAAAKGYRGLKISFGQPVEGRQLLEIRLEKNQSATAGDWSLRQLRFPGAKSVRGHVGVVSAPGFRIAPAQVERLSELPLSYFPKQIAGLQQAWRLRESDWSAAVRIEALGQSVQADVFHLYSIKEGVVYGSVLINYFVVGAPANEWRIEVPQSVGNIDVVGQNVRRDWRREGDQIVVSLHQSVLGAATLLITFEQPMSARGGTINPGQVRPIGVQSERGFIEVVSPLQVKHQEPVTRGGLLKLEANELPAEYRALTTSPALAVYQYTARPIELAMAIEWYAASEMVDQVVDFAKLASRVSRDGEVVTEARYFVKTRGRKALRLTLPAGVKLWEARIDRDVVNARVDGEQTLLPLPARVNPNEPVAVTLRLGQTFGSASSLKLQAPRVLAPTIIEEWTLHADAGRLLVPQSGTIQPVYPPLTETGFEWIAQRGRMAITAVLAALGLGGLLLQGEARGARVSGYVFCLVAVAGSLLFAAQSTVNRRANAREVVYAATMAKPGEDVAVQVANVSEVRAMIVDWGVGLAVLGGAVATLGGVAFARGRVSVGKLLVTIGLLGLASGALAQRGGASLFFGALAAFIVLALILPPAWRWVRDLREAQKELPPEPPATGMSGATTLLLVLALGAVGLVIGSPKLRANEALALPPVNWQAQLKPAQSIAQSWSIRGERIYGEVSITVVGAPGESFLLLRPPAVLADFKGDGLRVSKVERSGFIAYVVTPERAGVVTAQARFEMPLVNRAQPIEIPTGAAAMQRLTVDVDQNGWEFISPAAVEVAPNKAVAEGHSAATLVFAPQAVTTIQLRPKQRDVGAEQAQFFAESRQLYVPGPGGVNGYIEVAIRPVQGRVAEVNLELPVGVLVGDVKGPAVGPWRFDPAKRRLHVPLDAPQTDTFSLRIETQRSSGTLPVDVEVAPIHVVGAAGEVGLLALGAGSDAQLEAIRATELTSVNAQDFPSELIPKDPNGEPVATIQQVWRFGQAAAQVSLRVAPVSPEIRVTGREVFSIDDDRLVLAADLNLAITRVGIFKFSFAIPENLEIEAMSGSALSHWTESRESGKRVITAHLTGRTLGEQKFALTLAGQAPRAQADWTVPKISVREATRQTGEAILTPGKGLHLRAVEREKATPLDPRSVGANQPGALAFRLLQDDWALKVAIEALEPWTTVMALQEVTLREGQTSTRLALRYRVENSAIKRVRVRLPGLSEERASTVRATGSAVSDIVRVPDQADIWEIRFQRAIAGETDVQIEFQGPASAQLSESIVTPVFMEARQAALFVAVRGGGRLELEAGALPRGWTRADWAAVPVAVQNRTDRTAPALCFRVAEPEAPLNVSVRRHEIAEALKLRVTESALTTLFSPAGPSLTAVELKLDVLEKSPLRVRLPSGAQLFNTFVNGESVSVVREGEAYLFHVVAASEADRRASVRMVFSAPAGKNGAVDLVGPSLNVPLENVTWRVVVPPGYQLDHYKGGLRLREDRLVGSFGLDQYQSLVASQRSADAKKAVELLKEANTWLARGDQQKAGEALSKVSNAPGLDEASNEDARVQLRNLKTQQALVGLNTRRQRLYLENRAEAAKNEQLEQAASQNPFIEGKLNFNPQQLDQLLMGNSVEENTALRGIATRLVDQQLTADPAPGAIDVALPERGRVMTFVRSVQVDGAAPLELKLEVGKASSASVGFAAFALLALGAVVWIPLSGKRA